MRLIIVADQACHLGNRLVGIQQVMHRHIHPVIEKVVEYRATERLLEAGFQRTFVCPDTESQVAQGRRIEIFGADDIACLINLIAFGRCQAILFFQSLAFCLANEKREAFNHFGFKIHR